DGVDIDSSVGEYRGRLQDALGIARQRADALEDAVAEQRWDAEIDVVAKLPYAVAPFQRGAIAEQPNRLLDSERQALCALLEIRRELTRHGLAVEHGRHERAR